MSVLILLLSLETFRKQVCHFKPRFSWVNLLKTYSRTSVARTPLGP